jgi:hypothetical protein
MPEPYLTKNIIQTLIKLGITQLRDKADFMGTRVSCNLHYFASRRIEFFLVASSPMPLHI